MDQQGSSGSRFAGLPRRRVLGTEVRVATTFRSRLLGLAGVERAAAPEGLLIPACRAVHTLGMRFAIDVHFLDGHGVELARRRALRPRRFAWCPRASMVLERPSGGHQ